MGSTGRIASLLAALALAIAAIVILLTPGILQAPNALAAPSALVVTVGCGAGLWNGRTGRRVALAVSGAGLVLSGLWLWLAIDGFGLGGPWVDDMVEAAILVAAFVLAATLLWLAGSPTTAGRVALGALVAAAVILMAVSLVVPVLPPFAPSPVPEPVPS